VKDQLFISDHENVRFVKIYNLQGQELIAVEKPGSSISVQSLKSGVHVVVLQKLNGSTRKAKVIKE